MQFDRRKNLCEFSSTIDLSDSITGGLSCIISLSTVDAGCVFSSFFLGIEEDCLCVESCKDIFG